MTNSNGSKLAYTIQIVEHELQIVSKKGEVKKRLPFAGMHVKNAPSEPRTELANGEELKVPMKWYSIRLQ